MSISGPIITIKSEILCKCVAAVTDTSDIGAAGSKNSKVTCFKVQDGLRARHDETFA